MPELQALCEEYLDRMGELEKRLLSLLGVALGLEPDFFSRHMDHPTYGFNINWYPGVEVVGEPEPGQFRIGPHTDFGTVTILDRQAGKGDFRSSPMRAGGRTPRSIRRRSPSTSVI